MESSYNLWNDVIDHNRNSWVLVSCNNLQTMNWIFDYFSKWISVEKRKKFIDFIVDRICGLLWTRYLIYRMRIEPKVGQCIHWNWPYNRTIRLVFIPSEYQANATNNHSRCTGTSQSRMLWKYFMQSCRFQKGFVLCRLILMGNEKYDKILKKKQFQCPFQVVNTAFSYFMMLRQISKWVCLFQKSTSTKEILIWNTKNRKFDEFHYMGRVYKRSCYFVFKNQFFFNLGKFYNWLTKTRI